MRYLGLLMAIFYGLVGILLISGLIQFSTFGDIGRSILGVILMAYGVLRFFKWKSKYEA